MTQETHLEFALKWTKCWAGCYQTCLPSQDVLDTMCEEFAQANANSPWVRVVLGWVYEKSQCENDQDLFLWCDKLGRVLTGPYFVKYRVDPASRNEMIDASVGNLGIQIWCSSLEDAAIVGLVYPEWIVTQRVFQAAQMPDTLRGMGSPPLIFGKEMHP